jgi:hypothetical protein
MALLSGYLLAYDISSRQPLWKLKFNDSIQCLLANSSKVYCGLSNGSLAVFETTQLSSSCGRQEEPQDVFHINLCKLPINCIELVSSHHHGNHLWLALSGCEIIVVDEQKLNIIHRFNAILGQFEHISSLKSSEHGVWISTKSSSVIHLYDKKTYTCKLSVDARTNLTCNMNKVS